MINQNAPSKRKNGCLIAAIVVGALGIIFVVLLVGLGSCAFLLAASAPTATPEIPLPDFKTSCIQMDYDKLARLPDENKGAAVKFTGEIIQVMDGAYRIAAWSEELGSGDSAQIVYVKYRASADAPRMLEHDKVLIYGTSQGIESYTSIFGERIEVPRIDARVIEIQK